MEEDNQHLGSTLTDSHDVRQNFLLCFRLLSFLSLFSKSYTYKSNTYRLDLSPLGVSTVAYTQPGSTGEMAFLLGGEEPRDGWKEIPWSYIGLTHIQG
ncbi:hypothetical protein ILYODFUR_034791 [Ilyodon furcidens]|uniref:Uncharacterized protein n=1 Tax=Ilyodon furcidens TaxID=33524 RepID=A0ABV0U083_9TELE